MKSLLITMSAKIGKPTKKSIFEYLKELCDNGIRQVLIFLKMIGAKNEKNN